VPGILHRKINGRLYDLGAHATGKNHNRRQFFVSRGTPEEFHDIHNL
jgi:hypothetical protein